MQTNRPNNFYSLSMKYDDNSPIKKNLHELRKLLMETYQTGEILLNYKKTRLRQQKLYFKIYTMIKFPISTKKKRINRPLNFSILLENFN